MDSNHDHCVNKGFFILVLIVVGVCGTTLVEIVSDESYNTGYKTGSCDRAGGTMYRGKCFKSMEEIK
jgi:hypothetical protein